jgi:hypothetical protein
MVIPYSVSGIHVLGRVRVSHHLSVPRRDEGSDVGGDRRCGSRLSLLIRWVLTRLFSPRSSSTRTPENSQPNTLKMPKRSRKLSLLTNLDVFDSELARESNSYSYFKLWGGVFRVVTLYVNMMNFYEPSFESSLCLP